MLHNNIINTLSHFISTLPSLGSRSAMKIVIQLLLNKEKMINLIKLLIEAHDSVKECKICGNLAIGDICDICKNTNRDINTICIVENVMDIFAIERANFYNGTYHVLHGRLSVQNSISPNKLNINSLLSRIENNDIKEIIIANSATTEGQTTAFFITDAIEELKTRVNKVFEITTLAKGMPVGAEVDYLDEGTIIASLKSRKVIC